MKLIPPFVLFLQVTLFSAASQKAFIGLVFNKSNHKLSKYTQKDILNTFQQENKKINDIKFKVYLSSPDGLNPSDLKIYSDRAANFMLFLRRKVKYTGDIEIHFLPDTTLEVPDTVRNKIHGLLVFY